MKQHRNSKEQNSSKTGFVWESTALRMPKTINNPPHPYPQEEVTRARTYQTSWELSVSWPRPLVRVRVCISELQNNIPHKPQGARYILTVHTVSLQNTLIQHVTCEERLTTNVWKHTSSVLVQIRSGAGNSRSCREHYVIWQATVFCPPPQHVWWRGNQDPPLITWPLRYTVMQQDAFSGTQVQWLLML